MEDRRSRGVELEDHGCSQELSALVHSFSPEGQASAYALLGVRVRDAASEQEYRQWLDAVCPRRARDIVAEDQGCSPELSALVRSSSPEGQAIAQALLGIPVRDATAEQEYRQWLDAVCPVREGSWDSAKHPRGGFSQNTGWFSPTGGVGGATEPCVEPTHGPGQSHAPGGSQPHFQTVGHKTPQPATGNHATPRSDIYLAQNQNAKDRAERDRILNALGGTEDTTAKKPGDALGKRTWISSGGSKFTGTLDPILEDGKSVRLRSSDGKRTVEVPVDKLSGHDQAVIKGMQAMPKNITLDTDGLAADHKQAWLDGVISDFGRLNELPGGTALLARIAKSPNGITIKSRDDNDNDGTGNRVNYNPAPGGSKNVVVSYSPTDTKGWKVDGRRDNIDRPPFLALGKELSTGEKAAKSKFDADVMDEEYDSGKFENQLRDEHNARLKDGDEKLPHRDLPKLRN